ncbi:MAG: TIGR04086 family membrane protein [Tissierellia bacterium]|nr:TIGR04086 family membrane protein [Tissierellia bacterium]
MKDRLLSRGVFILKGLVLSFIIALILVLVVSILLTYTNLKESRIPMLNTIIMTVSITIGGIYMAFKVDEKGWLNGGIIGALYFLILIFVNLLFIKPFIFDIYLIGKFFVSLAAGIIGGTIGINIK